MDSASYGVSWGVYEQICVLERERERESTNPVKPKRKHLTKRPKEKSDCCVVLLLLQSFSNLEITTN